MTSSQSRISSVYRGCHVTSSSFYGLKSRLICPYPNYNPMHQPHQRAQLPRLPRVVKGAGAVMLLFRLEYKTSVICHNVNT